LSRDSFGVAEADHMTNIDDEREIAKEAQSIVSLLVPSTPRDEAKIATLRKLAYNVSKMSATIYSSETAAFRATRGDAINKLNGVIGQWDNGSLTQETIDRAKSAIEAWLTALAHAS
jgi:hypothetical protein